MLTLRSETRRSRVLCSGWLALFFTMRNFIITHPILSVVLALIAGAIIAALYVWRSLGGRFLP